MTNNKTSVQDLGRNSEPLELTDNERELIFTLRRNPMSDKVKLTPDEQLLIWIIRSIPNSELRVSVQAGKLSMGKLFDVNNLEETMALDGQSPLSPKEEDLVWRVRVMRFGQLGLHVIDGKIDTIFSDSYRTFRFSESNERQK